MASKKPNQDPTVDCELAFDIFTLAADAALEAQNYRKLQHAVGVIVELRRRYPKAGGLVKFHAGISNMCASMATDPQDIQFHRNTAIVCAREFAKANPTSIECGFYLAYFMKNLSYDDRGLNQAIQECDRAINLEDSLLSARNWTFQLHGLRAQCDSKLDMLKQHTHKKSQLGQRNLQKRKPIFKLEQPADKIAAQEISDLDAEKIRRLVSSLPTGPGSEVVETARASSQEEQSRPQEIDVHVMSREVPILFFEHVRQDKAFLICVRERYHQLESEANLRTLADNLKYYNSSISNSDGVPSDEESCS